MAAACGCCPPPFLIGCGRDNLPVLVASSYSYCSAPPSSSPCIVCTTYDIVIIDDIREKEKETDLETKNDTKVRRKMQ